MVTELSCKSAELSAEGGARGPGWEKRQREAALHTGRPCAFPSDPGQEAQGRGQALLGADATPRARRRCGLHFLRGTLSN